MDSASSPSTSRRYRPSSKRVLMHFFPSRGATAGLKEEVRFRTAKRLRYDKDEKRLAKGAKPSLAYFLQLAMWCQPTPNLSSIPVLTFLSVGVSITLK